MVLSRYLAEFSEKQLSLLRWAANKFMHIHTCHVLRSAALGFREKLDELLLLGLITGYPMFSVVTGFGSYACHDVTTYCMGLNRRLVFPSYGVFKMNEYPRYAA